MSDSAMDASDTETQAPPMPANWTLRETGVAGMATQATFLAIFLIIGVVGNCVLVATIAQSNRLKGRVLNLYIISIALVNLVDCFGNMPLILGSTIKQEWDYGQIPCQINAFGLHLACVTMITGLMLMTLDRFLGVKNPESHADKFSVTKANILIIYSWVQAFALGFPLLLNSVPVELFFNRYLCSIKPGAPLVYLVFLSVFGYIVPVFLIIGFNVYIIKRGAQEKLRVRKMDFSGSTSSVSRLWTEINAGKYVGVLMILWCIFQGPYLLMSAIQNYKSSINIQFEFSVPWEVELAFTWMRLSYPIFLPIITLGWQKEVWQKFKNCVLCRKSNLILDASPKSTPDHRKGNVDTTADGVPVLFATENGLHIQTYGQEEYSDSEINDDYTGSKFDGTARKCDVMGSVLQMDDDTSDYDSSGEIDPFSGSNPISVRTEYEKSKTSINLTKDDSDHAHDNEGLDLAPEPQVSPRDLDTRASPVAGKKKRKKKKKEIVVDSVIHENNEHDNDVDPSARYDRTSHDSGRGSMEDRSKKRKEKREAREAIDRVEYVEGERSPHDADAETNVDDPEDESINEERKMSQASGNNNNSIEVKEASAELPRVKKKKKKKKPIRDESVEMTESNPPVADPVEDVIPVKDVGEKRRPLPPPVNLNPLEVERSNISSKPLNPPSKLPPVAARSHARRTSDQTREHSSDTVSENVSTLAHHRSNSESQLADQDIEPQRPIPAKRSRSKNSLVSEPVEPKPKPRLHKRAGTTDSQTHLLLSSSNTSTDLSEIQNYNAANLDNSESRLFTPAKPKRRTRTNSEQSNKDLTLDSDVSPR